MTLHRCDLPAVEQPMIDTFVCPLCRAAYLKVWGPRHGFLWLKRDLVWRRVGWR